MNILSAGPSATTADYARDVRARADRKQVEDSRKREVACDAAEARSSPRFAPSESRKSQAKAKLQQVREWLKIVRKLFAQNPKGMARALAQVFKDLKTAVEAYNDAGGQEMGATSEAVGAVLAGQPADDEAPSDPAKDPTGAAPAEDAEAAPDRSSGSTAPDDAAAARAADGASLYDAVVGEVRKQLGEDGLEFIKQVRGIVDDVRKLLETARGQAAIQRRDKETDKTFEDADKALKALNETMEQMTREIRRDAPSAGMTLSIAA